MFETECIGSRGPPVESTVAATDDGGLAGECPHCGAWMVLGYAALLPRHQSGTSEDVRR